jgi:hypothetical protein
VFTENEPHTGRRLGRRPPKLAPALYLGNFWTGAIPAHPASADHFAEIADWGMYANDAFGDCGPVSVANQRKLVTRYLTGAEQSVSQEDVFDLYRRSGNPDFDPATGVGDNGVDLQTMCEALVGGGIAGTKALAFAKVDVASIDEVRAAIGIFGSVLFGVHLEVAQQGQTNQGLWDSVDGSAVWGGHAVLGGKYAGQLTDDVSVITWASVVEMTQSFEERQVEEAWVVVWPEHLGSRTFQDSISLAVLAADYKELTGRDFPVPPPVPPVPAPDPKPGSDPLHELAAVLRQFILGIEGWLKQHGL